MSKRLPETLFKSIARRKRFAIDRRSKDDIALGIWSMILYLMHKICISTSNFEKCFLNPLRIEKRMYYRNQMLNIPKSCLFYIQEIKNSASGTKRFSLYFCIYK